MSELTEFIVEVITLGPIEKHPNADTLSITKILGYPVIIRTGDFQEGDRAVYVPVDALVPTSRPEFAFLAKPGSERHRVRAARLRGVFSMGLLVKPPPQTEPGQDVAELMDIQKYEPPIMLKGATQPKGVAKAQTNLAWMPVYGVSAYRRHTDCLQEGEPVVITEKLHGTNARYCFRGGKLYVGSHRTMRGTTRSPWNERWVKVKAWVRDLLGLPHRTHLIASEGDVWWQTAERLNLKEQLSSTPDCVIYGEILGPGIQGSYDYGLTEKEFRLFDVLDIGRGQYLNYDELQEFAAKHDFQTVPLLYRGPWSDACLQFANGKTTLPGKHIREGFVVKADPERFDLTTGRVSLKVVSEAYLLDKGT